VLYYILWILSEQEISSVNKEGLMKYATYVLAVLVLLLPFTFSAYGQEVKQEAKPGEAVKTEATPTGDVKQEAKEEKHEHAMGKEKRAVATLGADGIQRVEITGGEYYFDPNYIIVKVNVPVEFVVKKAAGITPHDMVVNAPEAGIDFKVNLDEKKAAIVKFTPTKKGKYAMYCDKKLLFFKSHRERGMEGMIEVVE
jgi:plastocyanin